MAKEKLNGNPQLPNSGMRLAMLLTALDQCDNEFASERDDYKARRKVLENQLHSLKLDIITGQKSLLNAIDDLEQATGAKTTITLHDDKGNNASLADVVRKAKGDAHV